MLTAPAMGKLVSSFDALEAQGPDALLGLIALYLADDRADRIDLGVGVFRDDAGNTPVMRAVKDAERQLLADQASKAYLGAEGDQTFTDLLAAMALGDRLAGSDRLTGVQTPGGTGALRVGAALLALVDRDASVWMGSPTWPNHRPVFQGAGLRVREHRFYDSATALVDFEGMMADLDQVRSGDALLLHGCCHNPSGAGFTPRQWQAIASFCVERGVIPFIDLAYQGLGDGVQEDAEATRLLLETVPDALVAYSCDKNFGLYRDRVGALWVQTAHRPAATLVRGNLLSITRSMWSMPPDHGAAVVRTILQSDRMTYDWLAELAAMRARINGLRSALGAAHPALSFIADQRGMFALLPIPSADVATLRERHGIYMAGNGRINIAGLRDDLIAPFAAALAPILPR